MGSPKSSVIDMAPYDNKVCSHPGCDQEVPDRYWPGGGNSNQSVANWLLQHKLEEHGELIPGANQELQDNNGDR